MNILVITPAPPRSRHGNRVTALRWTRILRKLGHRVAVAQQYHNQRCDMMIALHARKSFASVKRFRHAWPGHPIIVALTGTDLYADIRTHAHARLALRWADRLVVLQPLALDELPIDLHRKTHVILQSVTLPPRLPSPSTRSFRLCVLGHLRPVKDPFRAALAARLLPPESLIEVVHLGAALSPTMKRAALRQNASNTRYKWLGSRPHAEALAALARSRALVLTSVMEGGANAVCEAVRMGKPVITSRIAGSLGILGESYPACFDIRDTQGLAALMYRLETQSAFRNELAKRCRAVASLLTPRREQDAWKQLLRELDKGDCSSRKRKGQDPP